MVSRGEKKKGRMTQKGIDETIVQIGDHDVELVIRGLVQFAETLLNIFAQFQLFLHQK